MNWPHLAHGLAFEWNRIRRQSIHTLLFKLIKRVVSLTLWLILLPLSIALHLTGYRRVTVFTERIGHLALEPDCLLKEQALGFIPKHRWFILAPPGRVANEHMLTYWRPLIRVYEGKLACFILESMSRFGLMRHDISRYILAVNKAQTAFRIYTLWQHRPPLLTLTPADEEWGLLALRKLGVPDDAWFVCVHVREAGFSPIDETLHAHRNGSIEATLPAMQEIVRRGGWVIRIGDATMKPLPPMLHVIDYAHHATKCARLDIILCAKARFILGSTSGITLVGTVFGVPCALANVIPLSTLWLSARDISIPKLLWSEHLSRYLRFDEVLASPAADYRYAALYRESGIRVDENTPEEICDLATEMLDNLEGKFAIRGTDEKLAHGFHQLIREKHYSFGSSARVSTLFLRRHAELLPGDHLSQISQPPSAEEKPAHMKRVRDAV